jgi:hypothetical protein
MRVTKSELIERPRKLRPHVVILGAGASVAAFPKGDRNGKQLPTMENLVEIIGLDQILQRHRVEHQGRNFEAIYSEIHSDNPEAAVVGEIEETVRSYFESLELPEEPTIYDHLVLSLRPKDIVATFNWDPFLFDAWNRNRHRVTVPGIAHLHGNVRIGICLEHHVQGENNAYCPDCDRRLTSSRLFYPVTLKNYSEDLFIKGEWEALKFYLRNAFALTIFGYGAPNTDKEAIQLMKDAWSGERERQFETTEIVDIKESSVIREQWDPFIHSQHYQHFKEFYDSWIPRHVRRSCEALFAPTVEGKWVEDILIPKEMCFDDLLQWLEPFLRAEEILSQG